MAAIILSIHGEHFFRRVKGIRDAGAFGDIFKLWIAVVCDGQVSSRIAADVGRLRNARIEHGFARLGRSRDKRQDVGFGRISRDLRERRR
jgi:hypothetical protein